MKVQAGMCACSVHSANDSFKRAAVKEKYDCGLPGGGIKHCLDISTGRLTWLVPKL